MTKRLVELDSKIKQKFQGNYQLVGKAFLDNAKDGYLSTEQLIRLFEEANVHVNRDDFRLLVKIKDSTGRGQLNYSDFSKWLGTSIHPSEGFYFRHDSSMNSEQQFYLKNKQLKCPDLKVALTIDELEDLVWQKIGQQRKSILHAYKEIAGASETNGISAEKMKFQMKGWGLDLS